jgi:GT2 family glycosyltransferase
MYFGHSLGLGALLPKLFPYHFMREFDHMTSRKVDNVIGAFFFVRRKLFVELGGFDERFFMYFEDIDFARRAAEAGWVSWYLAEAVAVHRGGGTSEQVKAHRLFYSLRSRIFYAFKHFPRNQAWLVTVLTIIVEPGTRMVRSVVRQSFRDSVDLAKGYLMLWRELGAILTKARDGKPMEPVSYARKRTEEKF